MVSLESLRGKALCTRVRLFIGAFESDRCEAVTMKPKLQWRPRQVEEAICQGKLQTRVRSFKDANDKDHKEAKRLFGAQMIPPCASDAGHGDIEWTVCLLGVS